MKDINTAEITYEDIEKAAKELFDSNEKEIQDVLGKFANGIIEIVKRKYPDPTPLAITLVSYMISSLAVGGAYDNMMSYAPTNPGQDIKANTVVNVMEMFMNAIKRLDPSVGIVEVKFADLDENVIEELAGVIPEKGKRH